MQVPHSLSFFLKKSSWAILPAFFFLSCMPDPLEVKELPSVEPEIVVATQLIPEKEIVVWLTSTFMIQQANEELAPEEMLGEVVVQDAVVTLSGPGGTYSLEYLERGLYGGIEIPFNGGEEYELLVDSRSHGEVKATAVVKPQVKFKSLSASLYYNYYDDTLGQVIYTIIDPPEKNWYMLNVQKINPSDPAEIILNLINPETFTSLLDDVEIEGQEYGGQLDFSLPGLAPGDSVAISISNISEAYFRFMEQRLQNRLSFMEFLSEPVNYSTNVTGGRGFFNLHKPDVQIMVLEEE